MPWPSVCLRVCVCLTQTREDIPAADCLRWCRNNVRDRQTAAVLDSGSQGVDRKAFGSPFVRAWVRHKNRRLCRSQVIGHWSLEDRQPGDSARVGGGHGCCEPELQQPGPRADRRRHPTAADTCSEDAVPFRLLTAGLCWPASRGRSRLREDFGRGADTAVSLSLLTSLVPCVPTPA